MSNPGHTGGDARSMPGRTGGDARSMPGRTGGDAKHSGLGLRALLILWLTIMWVLLWGDLSLGNVAGGVLLASLVLVAFPPLAVAPGRTGLRPWRVLRFGAWLAWALVVSSLTVAWAVLDPRGPSRQRPGIVAVPLRTTSARLATIVANSITLTPGTLTLEARGLPATLYVHVMSLDDPDQVRSDVASIEELVVRAFGSANEVARLSDPVDDATSLNGPAGEEST